MAVTTDNLYIRQVFGGPSLLDADKEQIRYTVERAPYGWKIGIEGIDEDRASALKARGHDLNVFHATTSPEGATVKSWYYPLQHLEFVYDASVSRLEIQLDGFMQYPAD